MQGQNAVEFQSGLGGARGKVIGVLKQENDTCSIFVTQTQPGLPLTEDIKELRGESKEKNEEENTNNIGFYVACQMGLAFSQKNLVSLIH
jgi:hypothetical protein